MKFHKELVKQATDVLDPIMLAATWTVGITAAAGTDLTQSLFLCLFKTKKSFPCGKHFGSLCHACAHCRRFAAAALRRAGNSVSDSLSGRLR